MFAKSHFRMILLFLVLACQSCAGAKDNQATSDLELARALIEAAENSTNRATTIERSTQAISLLTEAIESGNLPDGSYAEALQLRVTANLSTEQFDAAIHDLNLALEHDPGNLEIYYRRANMHKYVGNFEEALSDFSYIIEMDSTSPMIHRDRSAVLIELGRFEDAITDLSNELKIDPNSMGAFEMRGDTFAAIGRYDEALFDYRRVVDMVMKFRDERLGEAVTGGFSPEEVRLRLKIGNIWEKSGNKVEAVSEYTTILGLDPKNDEAQERRKALRE